MCSIIKEDQDQWGGCPFYQTNAKVLNAAIQNNHSLLFKTYRDSFHVKLSELLNIAQHYLFVVCFLGERVAIERYLRQTGGICQALYVLKTEK